MTINVSSLACVTEPTHEIRVHTNVVSLFLDAGHSSPVLDANWRIRIHLKANATLLKKYSAETVVLA